MMHLERRAFLRRLLYALVLYGGWPAAALVLSAGAAAQASTETAVKAAYIYRFLEYVTWPAESFRSPEDPIVVGVTQEDPIAAELRRIAGDRLVHNRKMTVVAFRQDRDPVHVLYVAASDIPKVLKGAVRQRPILIVTDAPNGLEQGATINLVHSDGRIKFEVSVDAAQRAGLTISARLLGLATRIKKGEQQRIYYAAAHIPRRAGELGYKALRR